MAKTNWRILRIAESICSCVLTDGFCGPKNRPGCRCWLAARAAVQGLQNQANACIDEAWPRMWNTDERRSNLDALAKAIITAEDELTAMHRAEADTQS